MTSKLTARDQSLPPTIAFYPRKAAPTGSYAFLVWAPPVSLAATPGILSFPRGTEMFQFPRFPPCKSRVTAHHGRRVAPFGDLWITGCQPLPRAFRRVAASFLGSKAPRHPPSALHRTCCSTSSLITNQGSPPSPTRATSFPRSPRHPVRRPAADFFTRFSAVSFLGSVPGPSLDVAGPTLHASQASPSHDGHARVLASFITPARFRFPGSPPRRDPARSARSVMLSRCTIFRWGDLVIVDQCIVPGRPVLRPVEPRGFEPRTSAVQGRRSPG